MGILVSETWVNATENHIVGDSDVYESFADTPGQLFRFLQKEYGRCVSRQYIDKKDGKTVQVGWVFEKTCKYTDTNEKYTQETWVTLHTAKPTKTTTYHFMELPS